MRWKSGDLSLPPSVCSVPCRTGERKKVVKGVPCCWHCERCEGYHYQVAWREGAGLAVAGAGLAVGGAGLAVGRRALLSGGFPTTISLNHSKLNAKSYFSARISDRSPRRNPQTCKFNFPHSFPRQRRLVGVRSILILQIDVPCLWRHPLARRRVYFRVWAFSRGGGGSNGAA